MKAAPFAVSELDSARFGRKIIRGTVTEESPINEVLSRLLEFGADIAIFRCPAGSTRHSRHLSNNGYFPIHADTLVYYSRSLTISSPAPTLMEGIDASLARPEEQLAVAEVARMSFSDYRSHYLANPLLDSRKVLEGYVEWAQAHLATRQPNRDTWVVRMNGRVCGFATCIISSNSSSIEIILNAVSPTHMRRGLYGYLLNSIIHYYSRRGLKTLVISTQIWNYAVQRAWTRAGLTLQLAFDTYHVNAIPDISLE